jgi:Domain of unknown function (DUF4136)
MRRKAALAAALATAWAACASVQVTVDYDTDRDFSHYRTFDWLPQIERGGPGTPARNPLVDNPLFDHRVVAAVERTLAQKGYLKVEDQVPDFYVAFFATTENKLDIYTVDRSYYGRWGWGISMPETHVQQYQEGTLVIDVSDARDHELVWRGVGSGRLRESPTPEQTTRAVDEAVAEILARFPPEPKASARAS